MDLYKAAVWWWERGFSILPVTGKKPAVHGWGTLMQARPTREFVDSFFKPSDFMNVTGIGVVCGIGGLVVMDLDGDEAVDTFHSRFPHHCDTFTVRSGSGHGEHLYFRPNPMPPTARVKGYELRANGCYVVAPPSAHPSGGRYEVINRVTIKQDDLSDVLHWIRGQHAPITTPAPRSSTRPMGNDFKTRYFNRALEGEIARVASAPQGTRNTTLFFATKRLAALVEDARIPQSTLRDAMTNAALAAGLDDSEIAKTIDSGIEHGVRSSRAIPTLKRNSL